ncbi:UL8 DNA helicase-primase associated protein [Meleagrid alphaherpesvirus 1]|uniref:UL8 DNA helicase-primase associated protein n=1 Tax=Meleagrid herpesvirus 1 TaxID=37108 RepID=Q9DPS6_MEHV1|nr:helicase-primase subunit [Meleagrid alphaherpesvirus 1]AKQ48596.1 helicase-primase subunit [iBAC vector pMeHV1-C7]AKQ48668.1 helicase-primase subunit [iBAC vector pMeHV1-C9]AKQ48740.1 helicase-primase subunit [iBAC vector pMeHV1-C10]AKQ48812.1 helicase-primase subunit [iBAC vector pMeHV1-C17]AKQ48884.1 helicase-primase subunit [iBAC vector pMeHV1-C18]
MNDISAVELQGCICYATLYRLWTSSNHDEGLTALCYLLFRDVDGNYAAHYATVNFSGKSLAKAWGWNPETITDATLASMANAAATNDRLPFLNADQNTLWKALLAFTLSNLRHRLGYNAYYTPINMHVDKITGLVLSCTPLNSEHYKPRPGLLKTDGTINIDESSLLSAAMKFTNGTTLARVKLSAMSNIELADFDAKIEIQTKNDIFYREYTSRSSRTKKTKLHVSDNAFHVAEKPLIIDGASVRTLTLVPASFDILVTTPSEFSLSALMIIYTKWRETLFSTAGGPEKILTPIFTYIGPETNPEGEDLDYACIVGFPGWPMVKSSTASHLAIKEVIDSYAATDGLWPMAGARTFHLLAPWRPDNHPSPTIDICHYLAESNVAQGRIATDWGEGRLTCFFREPTLIENAAIAKLDFSAFFATLYLGLFPCHTRLRDAVLARLRRESDWLKRPIVEFGGLLKHFREDIYKAIVGIGNLISLEIESAASTLMFAPCIYVRDGMWGAFIDKANGTIVSPEGNGNIFETLRVLCNESANRLTTSIGLRFPDGINLQMRLEGVYTHAMSWNVNCYWLWNRNTRESNFVGFPKQPEFATHAKEAMSTVLEEICLCADTEDALLTIQEKVQKMYHDLLYMAFKKRGDASFWCCATDSYNDSLYAVALGSKAASRCDTSAFRREMVQAVTTNGNVVPVVCSLFGDTHFIVPAISCVDHMKPVLSALSRLLGSVIAFKWPSVDQGSLMFDVDHYRFMFIRNK